MGRPEINTTSLLGRVRKEETVDRIDVDIIETGWRPGTLCNVLALGQVTPLATKYKETTWD